MPSRRKNFIARSQRLASTLRYALVGHFFLWLTGCYYLPKSVSPIRSLQLSWTPGERQSRLIVYLPGRKDRPEDFETKGLWQALQQQPLPFDAVAVDAHLGYYLKMSVVERILRDVVEPARARGYTEIYVVGNSLGGLGALLVEKSHPGTWAGIFLLAPFLGDDKDLYRAFENAGGVRKWAPDVDFARTDFSPRLWLWLKDWPEHAASRPPLYLAYGESDRLRLGIDHLSPLLPPHRVLSTPGAHNWQTWLPLWRSLLDAHVAPPNSSAP